jgi:hypothetical protein
MKKRSVSLLVVLGLMVLTSLGLVYGVDVRLDDRTGVRMALPARLGAWTGHELRFCHTEGCRKEHQLEDLAGDPTRCPDCGGPLFNMSREEYEQLPKDTGFIKSRYTNPDGDTVFVSIVLSGRDRESIHRPERCLVGQGHEIRGSRALEVPLPGGRHTALMVMDLAKDFKTREGPFEYTSYYAYWFVGQQRETPYHLERMFWLAWDRLSRSVAHKWAYISISGKRDPKTKAYETQIREVAGLLHEQIVL